MLSPYFQRKTSNLAESYKVTEATIASLKQFDCFSESASEYEMLITDIRSQAIALTVESTVVPYLSSLCKNLRARFDIKAMSFLKLYNIFLSLNASENAETGFDCNGLLKELMPDDRDVLIEAPDFSSLGVYKKRFKCTASHIPGCH
jgi:hypothetical protein